MNYLFIFAFIKIFCYSFSAFDNPDDILFDFSWNIVPDAGLQGNVEEFKTVNGEIYKCVMPQETFSKAKKIDANALGIESELKLLEPIFKLDKCSIRVDSYWVFEVCHNKHIRQYHPVLASGQKLQQYFLGYSVPYVNQFVKKSQPVKTVKIDGKEYPYFKMDYIGGDYCELIDQKRSTSVLYICNEKSIADIHQVTEVKSCQYEIIVQTRYLCKDPKYQPLRPYINQIKCYNTNTSVPDFRPVDLIQVQSGVKHNFQLPSYFDKILGNDLLKDFKIEIIQEGSEIFLNIDKENILKTSVSEKKAELVKNEADLIQQELKKMAEEIEKVSKIDEKNLDFNYESELPDAQIMFDFLSKKKCLTSVKGNGVLTICFKKHIVFSYKDKTGKTVSQVWGVYDKINNSKMSLAFLESSDPIKDEESITFYTDGGACGTKVRSARLILKCSEDKSVKIEEYEENCVHTIYIKTMILCY